MDCPCKVLYIFYEVNEMKKILSAVAALGLVAGVATTAAALDFSVAGTYSATGNYLSDSNGSGFIVNEAVNIDNASDAYWMHTFAIKPTMTVNDNIKMISEMRLADNNVWGQGDSTNGVAGATNGTDVYVHRLYMQYMSPIGKIQLGRLSAGPWGTPFLDNDSRANGVKIWPSALASGPWSTYFNFVKGVEGDAQVANTASSNDTDSYEARVFYKTDALNAGIRYNYSNNQASSAVSSTHNTIMGLYGVYKMDNYFVATEIVGFGGSTEFDAVATPDVDRSATAALLEVGGTFDNLSVAAAYVYAEGDDNTLDNDNNAALFMTGGGGGTGTEFAPLYILTGRGMGCLNSDINGADNISGGDVATAGTHTFALLADYKTSDRLSLHAGIAYAMADEEVNSNAGVAIGTSYLNRGDEYGIEYDLGAAYKLLDNLTYEAHFAYLDTGDFFQASTAVDNTTSVTLMSHSLTMTF